MCLIISLLDLAKEILKQKGKNTKWCLQLHIIKYGKRDELMK